MLVLPIYRCWIFPMLSFVLLSLRMESWDFSDKFWPYGISQFLMNCSTSFINPVNYIMAWYFLIKIGISSSEVLRIKFKFHQFVSKDEGKYLVLVFAVRSYSRRPTLKLVIEYCDHSYGKMNIIQNIICMRTEVPVWCLLDSQEYQVGNLLWQFVPI